MKKSWSFTTNSQEKRRLKEIQEWREKENFKRYFQDGAGETWKGHLRSSPSIKDLSLM